MNMRTTIIIAPVAATKRLVQRANPVGAALKSIGIALVLLVLGLVYLLLSPIAWVVRKLSGARR